jgi:8-oxo-dGTP pyrophosphatase MutT (NUDIX family)
VSLLDRVRECARFSPGRYLPFRVDGARLGRVERTLAAELRRFAKVFRVSDDAVDLAPAVTGHDRRTEMVDEVLRALRDEGLVKGWRDEPYPVATAFSAPPLFVMERAAVPLFGVKGYGVHVNGWVDDGGAVKMWVGRRSLTKPTGPGKLDQVVAGGQPAGISVADNLIKECAEEAAIPPALARKAKAVGTVSYLTERPEGLRDDVLFDYDLELPVDFTPVNADGEVADFYLWPIERVIETLERSDAFKFNSGLVAVDFLVRRGFVRPDRADYVAIVEGLHARESGPG